MYGRCQNYRTEVEEYEGTVIYRTLLFYNSVFLKRFGNSLPQFTPSLFRRSIILVCSILVFPPYFSDLPILSYNCSIINFAESPFYNSGFYVTFFRGPRKIHKMMQIYVSM